MFLRYSSENIKFIFVRNYVWYIGMVHACADPGGTGGPDPPPPSGLKNHKVIGFLSNTGPDPLKYHKATNPAFNVGPSSACQRNAEDGLLFVVFGSSPFIKKKMSKVAPNPPPPHPSDKLFWIRPCRQNGTWLM